MASENQTQIAPLVGECHRKFGALVNQSLDDVIYIDSVKDEFGRFRVWAGNVAAHRTGRRSLQYRLRDSTYLSETVIAYLESIITLLDLSRMSGQSTSTGEVLADEEDDDASLFGPDSSDGQVLDPRLSWLSEIGVIVTCLLRVSIALRNPTRNDQIRYAEVLDTKPFEQHDIEHIRMKYPGAADFLITRLGKAVSRHRHYFRYREEHHNKLIAGLDGQADEGQESTVATSLQAHRQLEFEAYESDDRSEYTATSFAPTLSREVNLQPPQRPSEGQDGRPFECPLCYNIIVAPTERTWKQHLFEDLPPYLCFEEHCKGSSRQYDRRRDWKAHVEGHNQHWICPFKCATALDSEQSFIDHVQLKHEQTLDPAALKGLCRSCVRDKDGVVVSEKKCMLCLMVLPRRRWLKHIGHHMEEIALFAVPRHLWEEDAQEDSDEGDGPRSTADTQESESIPSVDAIEALAADTSISHSTGPPMVPDHLSSVLPTRATEDERAPSPANEQALETSVSPELNPATFSIPLLNVEAPSPPESLPPTQENSPGRDTMLFEHMLQEELQDMSSTEMERGGKDADAKFQGEMRRGLIELDYSEETSEIKIAKEKAAKAMDSKKRQEEENERKFQEEMRYRLRTLGYTEKTIEIMVDKEKSEKFKNALDHDSTRHVPGISVSPPETPIYPKVRREFIATETLQYYDLPWEYDRNDSDYIIILREMSQKETDVLFEHTKHLRSKVYRLVGPIQR